MRPRRTTSIPAAEPAPLHVCDGCRRPFVVPISVLAVLADGRCVVELSCANCGRLTVGSHGDAALEALDRELDEATAALHDAAAVLGLVDELERVERFAAALHDDLILPEDF